MKNNKQINPNHILLVAPTNQIANYWAKEMGLRYYKVITDYNQIKGLVLKDFRVIFVEEEPFDYPEQTLGLELRLEFYFTCEYIEEILKQNKLQGV